MSPVTKNVLQGTVIALVLTALSYALGVSFWGLASVNYLEAFAVLTSYVCTFLCVKERRINYPIGAISTAAYALLFFQSGLAASALLNLYLTPTLVYGWYRWRADSDKRPVTRVAPRMTFAYLGITALLMAGAVAITLAVGAPVILTDSAIFAGTILAQLLMDNKKIENWFVWMAVNGFAIYTYFHAGLFIVGFQYIFFLLNTFYGLYEWNRSKRNDTSVRIDDSVAAYEGPRAASPVLV